MAGWNQTEMMLHPMVGRVRVIRGSGQRELNCSWVIMGFHARRYGIHAKRRTAPPWFFILRN